MGKKYLESITITAKPNDYVLPFWPEARIPGGGTDYARWLGFLDSLSPKKRLAADPESKAVGVPFKNGIWHGDLVMADDVKSLSIIRDIKEITGDLMARGARVVNKNFTHPVRVRGGVMVHLEILREDPPDLVYNGDLHVFGAKFIQDITIAPQRFLLWGVNEDHRIRLREHMLMLVEEQEEEGSVFLLHDLATDDVYIWDFNRWDKAEKSAADQEVLARVNHKLTRVCKYIGLGQDFILLNNRKIGSNIRKICVYLRMLAESCCPKGEPTKKNLTTAPVLQVMTLLSDLEKNLYGSNVDVPNIELMLGMLNEDLLKAAAAVNARPRKGLSEDAVRHDMRYLTRLLQDDVSFNELIPSTPHLILFLNQALTTSPGKKALFKSIGPLLPQFARALDDLGLKDQLKFTRLLRKPEEVFELMRAAADGPKLVGKVEKLETYFNEIQGRAPREFTREVLTSMRALGVPPGSEDLELIQIMSTFSGGIDDFPINEEALLEFYLATLESPITGSLSRAKQYLAAGKESREKGIQIFVGKFMAVKNSSFVEFLLKRLEWDLSVLKKFNALSRSKTELEAKPVKKPEVEKGLRPEIEAELLYKINRISLYLGLGKGFLEQNTEAWDKNIGKFLALLEMWSGCCRLEDETVKKEKAVTNEFVHLLEQLREKGTAGDGEGVLGLLKAIDDNYIRRLNASLPDVETPLSPKGYQKDMLILEHLQKKGLTSETVFGTTEKFLYFGNTTFEAECLRKRCAGIAKPLNQALAVWKERVDPLENVTIMELLRKFESVIKPLKHRTATPEEREAAGELKRAVNLIRDTSVEETVVRLCKCAEKNTGAVTKRDKALLDALFEFESGTLNELRLDALAVVKLLLLHMSSPAVEDLKEMFTSGRLEGKPPLTVVGMVASALEQRENVVRAFNRLVGKARKR